MFLRWLAYPDNLGKLEEQLNEWGSELLKPLTDAVYEAIPSDGIRPTSGKGEGLLILLGSPRLRNGETEPYGCNGLCCAKFIR